MTFVRHSKKNLQRTKARPCKTQVGTFRKFPQRLNPRTFQGWKGNLAGCAEKISHDTTKDTRMLDPKCIRMRLLEPQGRMIQNINIASLITHGRLVALRTLRLPRDKQDASVSLYAACKSLSRTKERSLCPRIKRARRAREKHVSCPGWMRLVGPLYAGITRQKYCDWPSDLTRVCGIQCPYLAF